MSGRIVLNDAANLQNVVSKKELIKETKNTLKQLTKQLLQISGPYSRNAFILYNTTTLNSGLNTDVIGSSQLEIFTRDGIHTLRQIQYLSPIQTYIKNNILAFIGGRIDACCSDGTTSSMIFTASFITYLMEQLDEFKMYSLTEIEQAYGNVISRLTDKLNNVKITKESLGEHFNNKVSYLDTVRVLAYLQAYTSSSGNKDVANAVADIFYNTPEHAWKYAIRQRFPFKETPTFKVEAKKEECQASYECTIMTPQYCNMDLGKYYQRDKVDILILRGGMIRGTQCTTALLNYIIEINNNKDKDTKVNPLVILLPTGANAHDFQLMSEVQQGALNAGLELFIAAYERPLSMKSIDGMYSMDALSAKANVNAFTENNVSDQDFVLLTPFLIKNASFKCDHYMCYIDNVIPYCDSCTADDIHSNVHPAEKYPESYEYYHIWKNFLMKLIEDDLAAGDKGNESTQKDLYRALMLMSCKNCWYIEIGGKSHDQQAIAHILDDAAGAALAAVKHGLYLNGPCKLYTQVRDLYNEGNSTPIETAIILAITRSARDLIYAIFGENATNVILPFEKLVAETKDPYNFVNFYQVMSKIYSSDASPFTHLGDANPLSYYWNLNKVDNLSYPLIHDRKYQTELEDGTWTAPPCQVGNLFDVLFERIREVALRFVFTDSIVAPGTVWDNKLESAEQK